MGKDSQKDQAYSEEEIARRRDAALRRALVTPRKPHKPIGEKKKSPKAKRG